MKPRWLNFCMVQFVSRDFTERNFNFLWFFFFVHQEWKRYLSLHRTVIPRRKHLKLVPGIVQSCSLTFLKAGTSSPRWTLGKAPVPIVCVIEKSCSLLLTDSSLRWTSPTMDTLHFDLNVGQSFSLAMKWTSRSVLNTVVSIPVSSACVREIRELTKRGRRRLRGLHLKIQVRVIHITTKLFHVLSR